MTGYDTFTGSFSSGIGSLFFPSLFPSGKKKESILSCCTAEIKRVLTAVLTFTLILLLFFSWMPQSFLGISGDLVSEGSMSQSYSELLEMAGKVLDRRYREACKSAMDEAEKAARQFIESKGDDPQKHIGSISLVVICGHSAAPESISFTTDTANRLIAVYSVISSRYRKSGAGTCIPSFADAVEAFGPSAFILGETGTDIIRTVSDTVCYSGTSSCRLLADTEHFMEKQKEEIISDLLADGVKDATSKIKDEIEEYYKALSSLVSQSSVSVNRKDLFTGAMSLSGYDEISLRTPVILSPFSYDSVTSWFGERILRGKKSFHGGIDFGKGRGTPVRSSDTGLVIYSYSGCHTDGDISAGYGNYVIIYHGRAGNRDIYTLYAHLHTVDVRAGDRVSQGQQLGTVGSRGNSTGPHLHWEVNIFDLSTQKSFKVNPILYALEGNDP